MIITRKKYEADMAAAKEQGRMEVQEAAWRDERLNCIQKQVNEIGEAVGELAEAVGKKRGLPVLRRLDNVRFGRVL